MGGIAVVMWWIIPEIFGLANTYCLSFPLGVCYAEYICISGGEPERSKEEARGFSIFHLMIFIFAAIGFFVMLHVDEPASKIFGIQFNFYVYTLVTNVVYATGAYCLIVLSEWISNKSMSRVFADMGGMSMMIYYLQEPLIVYPLRSQQEKVYMLPTMIIGLIFVFLFSFIYYKRERIFSKVRLLWIK